MEQAVNILLASLNSPVWHLTDQAEYRFTSHMHHSAKFLTTFLLLLFQLAKIKVVDLLENHNTWLLGCNQLAQS